MNSTGARLIEKETKLQVNYNIWRSHNLREDDGVLLGADQTQEWILPWWWGHYSKNNDLPVAFVDFGMSFEMKDWCKERGELVPLRLCDFAKERHEVDAAVVKKFEKHYNGFWDYRKVWFKKPFALLQSPFKKTVWVDLDCEIRCSLAPLFKYPGFSAVKEPFPIHKDYPVYNSGVIVFQRGMEIIQMWACESFEKNDRFVGDQDLLSWIIEQNHYAITDLPVNYNWSRKLKDPADIEILILHWHGDRGKDFIRYEISRDAADLTETFLKK